MKPRMEALAFRVWQTAHPLGWNITIKELAELLGVNWRAICVVIREKKWTNRLRAETIRETQISPLDVPRYDPVWHKTFALEAHETTHAIRRFGV